MHVTIQLILGFRLRPVVQMAMTALSPHVIVWSAEGSSTVCLQTLRQPTGTTEDLQEDGTLRSTEHQFVLQVTPGLQRGCWHGCTPPLHRRHLARSPGHNGVAGNGCTPRPRWLPGNGCTPMAAAVAASCCNRRGQLALTCHAQPHRSPGDPRMNLPHFPAASGQQQ